MQSKLFVLFALVAFVSSQTIITLSTQAAGGQFGITPSAFLNLNASISTGPVNATAFLSTAGLLPSIYIQNGGIQETLSLTLYPQSALSAQASLTASAIAYLQANGAVQFGSISASGNVGVGGLVTAATAVQINTSAVILINSVDGQGTGNLVFSVPTALVNLGLFPISASVNLISADPSNSANFTIVAPLVSVSGSNTVYSYSIAYGRAYIPVVFTNSQWGLTFGKTFAAAVNTTTNLAANTYLTFSADQNIDTTEGIVVFYSANGGQMTVNTNSYGQGSYSAPSGVATIGQQLSITYNSNGNANTNYNGNLTFVVQASGNLDTSKTSQYSWYKASSGTTNGSGFTKISSTVTQDSQGNVYVSTQVNGGFSEWTLGYPSSTTSSSKNSASVVALSCFAALAAVALAF